MKQALILMLIGLFLFAGAALGDIQAGYDPDDDGDRMRYGDGNELIFGGAASLRWEDADANAMYLLLDLPTGGAVDVPVFGIGIALDDVDLGDFNGVTQPTFFVADLDGDSEITLSFSGDDVGLLTGVGTIASFGMTFATMTNTASTTLVNYTPIFVVGFDVGAAMTLTTSDTSGDLAITHAGATPDVTWTADSFDFVGAFAADAVTVSDVLTFSDAATIDNTAAGVLTITEDAIVLTGDTSVTSTNTLSIGSNPVVLNHRHRVTVAEINAGHELLPAIAGRSYRVIECLAIAYGGAVGTTTTVDLLGTQSAGGVKLVAYAQAGLTQSSVLVSGGTNAAVTADAASYAACDANTAITVGKTGGDADTATGVDFILTYVIE